jgi:hypothetical protein
MKDERLVLSSGWVWRLRPEAKPWLRPALPAIAELRRNPSGELLKETGRRRAIWKFQPEAGPPLFVKHYGRPRLLQQLKYRFRNSRSRQEWEAGLKLEAQGFPVVRHQALGERFAGGLLQEDYLVQDYLEGFRNFDRFFEVEFSGRQTPAARRERNVVIQEFARLIRRLHDQGALQRDFKPDSVMVARANEGFQFRLVDLERVRLSRGGRGLSPAERLDNLAKLDQTFGFLGNTADRLRFWRAYFELPELRPLPVADGFARVSALAEAKFRKRARERQVWPLGRNQVYDWFDHGPWRVHYHRELSEELLHTLVEELNSSGFDSLPSKISGAALPLRLRITKGVFRPGLPLGFGGARYGLALVASLYYRRVPFVPARAAIVRRRGGDIFQAGLLALDPGPPFLTWSQAGPEMASEVGAFLRVLHRMGMVLGRIQPDSLLADPERPAGKRLFLNRVEDLILDQTISPDQAQDRLRRIAEMLTWPESATIRLLESYQAGNRRWFQDKERW